MSWGNCSVKVSWPYGDFHDEPEGVARAGLVEAALAGKITNREGAVALHLTAPPRRQPLSVARGPGPGAHAAGRDRRCDVGGRRVAFPADRRSPRLRHAPAPSGHHLWRPRGAR